MTQVPKSLKGAPWLGTAAVQAIFSTLARDGEEVRIVGGAVRNALFGVPVADVDFATTATPDVVTQRFEGAGFKVVPTGIEHGTLTIVSGEHGYEVTTLREDIETDGRRAVVRFGRDWLADARRRDFTVNALSVGADGTVYDPLGGSEDIVARRIRFIGDPDKRIAEDRLRILRFFRFHAQYGEGELDRPGLAAAIRARDGLRDLSAERVGREMRSLAVAAGAFETVATMQDSGILPVVFGGIGYVAALRRLMEFEAAVGLDPSAALRLAAMGCRVDEDALRLAERLRLANAERDRMRAAIAVMGLFPHCPAERAARPVLYRYGETEFRDGIALAFAWSSAADDMDAWRHIFALPDRWQVPGFPLGGRDVLGQTNLRGAAVGSLLKALEAWWIENDFAADEAALRHRLQQMVAAVQ